MKHTIGLKPQNYIKGQTVFICLRDTRFGLLIDEVNYKSKLHPATIEDIDYYGNIYLIYDNERSSCYVPRSMIHLYLTNAIGIISTK